MVPTQPFNYTFMDADFNNVYTAEQRTGTLFITFAVFAILIGCLGLFGLVTYAAEQRTKEIGVRKVLGASVSGIVDDAIKRFCKTDPYSIVDRFPDCVVEHAQMVTKFCLQDHDQLVGFYSGSSNSHGDRDDHS